MYCTTYCDTSGARDCLNRHPDFALTAVCLVSKLARVLSSTRALTRSLGDRHVPDERGGAAVTLWPCLALCIIHASWHVQLPVL